MAHPFSGIGAGVAAPLSFLSVADMQGMYGANYDLGLMPVLDPTAPRFAEGFVKAADIFGEGVQGEFAGGGGFLNIGPNAISSMGTFDPQFEQIGIRRNISFDPFMGTHGAGGAFFSNIEETRRAFEELGLASDVYGGRSTRDEAVKAEQRAAFEKTLESGDAFAAQSFFDQSKLEKEYGANLMDAWQDAAARLQLQGSDYLKTLWNIPEGSPAEQDVTEFWSQFQQAQDEGGGWIQQAGPMFGGAGRRRVNSVGAWLAGHMGNLEPEDIAPFSVDTQGIENLQQKFTGGPPVAAIAYDAPGAAGALGGLGGLRLDEQDAFDSFYGLGAPMGGYY